MKYLKKIGIGLILVMILIQFFPGEQPETSQNNPGDIHNEIEIEQDISKLLKTACYDCHSNETVYPWYSGIAPVSWLVNHDVEEGRDELNFSEWANYSLRRKNHKLEEVIELVEEGEMPIPIYTITHSDAKLSQEEIKLLVKWAKDAMVPEIENP